MVDLRVINGGLSTVDLLKTFDLLTSVSLKELILISGLTRGQVRYLFNRELLDRQKPPNKYHLSELIYCRIVYWLNQLYGLKKVTEFIRPRDMYLSNLVVKKYGVIEFTDDIAIELDLTDELEKEGLVEELNYKIFIAKTKEIPDKYRGKINVNVCYLNIENIKTEVAPPPLAA